MRNIITLDPETADHHGIFVFMQQHTTAFLENRYEFISWNFLSCIFASILQKTICVYSNQTVCSNISKYSFD